MNVESLSLRELLTLHSRARELQRRNICRTSNNPTADLAEWIVAAALDLKLEMNSTAGFDARDAAGVRYEIKGRRARSGKPPKHTSLLRGIDNRHFDHLVIVVFEEDYSIRSATRLPFETVQRLARFRKRLNGSLVYLCDLRKAAEAEDLTARLQSALNLRFDVSTRDSG